MPLSAALLSLLRGLTREQWQNPTACGAWSVKDVAGHLLGGNLGRLSFQRDRLSRETPRPEPLSGSDLAALVNRLNAEWVISARRISPNLLIDFLELTDRQVAAFFETLPPDAPASIGVSWAGEAVSANWFDIAREYTEKWVHQQHIRDAVHMPGATEPALTAPVLDIFMRALPHTYRGVSAPGGTALNFSPAGSAGKHWTLVRRHDDWELYYGLSPDAVSHVWLEMPLAWRLFTNGFDPHERRRAAKQLRIDGDRALGEQIAAMVTIVA